MRSLPRCRRYRSGFHDRCRVGPAVHRRAHRRDRSRIGAGDRARGRLLSPQRREALAGAVTMDMDSTDVEVFGSDKQGVAYNYCGQRCGRRMW